MSDLITRNKKLLIITYYWPPAGGPGVQRWVKFTSYLTLLGYELCVLTVDEKQAAYAHRDNSLQSEIPESVNVFRTKTRGFYSAYLRITGKENIPYSGFVDEGNIGMLQKVLRFLRSNFFIPDPRRGWNRFAVKKALQLIRQENITLVITTSPPHSTQLIGKHIKRKIPSIQWIADFRDPWTGIFYFDQLCHSPMSRYLNLRMEKKILTTADQVVVVSKSMKSDFLRKVEPAKHPDNINIISNGFDAKDFAIKAPLPEKVFTLTYTGTLAPNYTIDALLDALRKIREENSGIRMTLRFIGEVCPEYRVLLNAFPFSESIELISRVSHEAIIRYMLSSHVLLLIIPQARNNEAIITGKIFEYMAAKKPVLGIGPTQGDAANLLSETSAGAMFEYDDALGIKKYLWDLVQKSTSGELLWQGQNIEKYSRENLTRQLTRLF
jgi:glycosyltransferase involved in cell wall biosynthesis